MWKGVLDKLQKEHGGDGFILKVWSFSFRTWYFLRFCIEKMIMVKIR